MCRIGGEQLARRLRWLRETDRVSALTERLRDLEAAGVLERRVVPASPPYAEYRLTERGARLAAVVRTLSSQA